MTGKYSLALIAVVGSGTLLANGFEKKYEMMDSRIHSKMEKYKGNQAAQDFLNKKLICIKNGKTVDDLKACNLQNNHT